MQRPKKTIAGENFEKAWKTVVGLIIVILTVPITIPIFVLFYTIGESTKKYFKETRGISVAKARGLDGAFAHDIPESRPFINASFTFVGKADLEYIRKKFQKSIIEGKDDDGNDKYHKLVQNIGKEFPYFMWRDSENFDLANHIRLLDIEEYFRGDIAKESSETQLKKRCSYSKVADKKLYYHKLICKYLEKHGNDSMSVKQPQWEMIVVPRSDNRY